MWGVDKLTTKLAQAGGGGWRQITQGLWALGLLGRPGEPQGVVQLGCVMTEEAFLYPRPGSVPALAPTAHLWGLLACLSPLCYSRLNKARIWTNSFTSVAWDLAQCWADKIPGMR